MLTEQSLEERSEEDVCGRYDGQEDREDRGSKRDRKG